MPLVRRVRRSSVAAVAALSLVALAVIPPVASTATGPTCSVRNTTRGTSHSSMQRAVTKARAGNRLELRGRCSGPIAIGKNLTIVGVRTSATGTPTLTGNDMTRVLWIKGTASVTLSTLVIRDGYLPDTNDYFEGSGAGIFLEGTAVLKDVIVRDNVTTFSASGAGGIEVADGAAKLTLAGTTELKWNEGGWGGAIENYGTLVIKDRAGIHDNTARQGGGGMYDSGEVATVLRNKARIFGNTAPDGGGVYLSGVGLTMLDTSSIDHNTATSGSGGGILREAGTLTDANCGGNVHDNTPVDIAPDCV